MRVSPCTGGVNRLVNQAGPSQASDAFDVLADDGMVRRRPAFNIVGHGDPYYFPQANVVRLDKTFSTGFFSSADSGDDIAATSSGVNIRFTATRVDYQFEGLHFPVSGLGGNPSAHRIARGYYWNGSSSVPIPGFVDFTESIVNGYRTTMAKYGTMVWPRPSDWVKNTFGSNLWEVIILVEDLDGAEAALTQSVTIDNPGIRMLRLGPIVGMDEVSVTGVPTLIAASRINVGKTNVARIASMTRLGEPPVALRQVVESGPGIYGERTFPEPLYNDASSGLFTTTQNFSGQLLKMEKQRPDENGNMVDYEWVGNQFRGRLIIDGEATAIVSTTFLQFAGRAGEFQEDELAGYRVIVRNPGTSSLAVGTHAQIKGNYDSAGDLLVELSPALGTTTSLTTTFDLREPSVVFRFRGSPDRGGEVTQNAQQFALFSQAVYAPQIPDNGLYIFRAEANEFGGPPDGLFIIDVDPVTGNALLFGGSAPLETDGFGVTELAADRSSVLALQLVGETPENALSNSPSPVALAQLRGSPPPGRFLVFYQSRIVTAGFADRPFDVAYSYPGAANNVWPLSYTTQIRDSDQRPISGLAVLNERLIAFSPRSIHEGAAPGESGQIAFNPISQGYGFVHQRATTTVLAEAAMIVGAGEDGINMWDGGTPRQVLDRWDRVLKHGVNRGALSRAVAAALPQRNLVFIAVPSAGSEVNDRILVWDYLRDTIYPWRFDRGVSSMAAIAAIDVNENLAIGTSDGMIEVLSESTLEDGASVDGYVRTTPLDPLPGQELRPTRMIVQARVLGQAQTLRMNLLGGGSDRPIFESAQPVDADDFHWADGTYTSQTAAGRDFNGERFWPTETPTPNANARRVRIEVGGSAQWKFHSPELFLRTGDARGRK